MGTAPTPIHDPYSPPVLADGDLPPHLRVLSLGAGVQSTALLIFAAQGRLPRLDAAVFADTGWEPKAVYDHLDRLEREVAEPAGIRIVRVAKGNIRDDALDPDKRMASLPYYVQDRQEGGRGAIMRRQCTQEYKIQPINRALRELLGYVHPKPVKRGVYVEQWIGISTDEADRAYRRPDTVKYTRNRFPLLEMGLSRDHCHEVLNRAGFGSTPKSACVGCPYRANAMWRDLRDNAPAEFADAVDFDRQLRIVHLGSTIPGRDIMERAYLHSSRVPLDSAPIERVSPKEWNNRQGDLLHELEVTAFEDSLDVDDAAQLQGCSPFGCVSGSTDTLTADDTCVECEGTRVVLVDGVETPCPDCTEG